MRSTQLVSRRPQLAQGSAQCFRIIGARRVDRSEQFVDMTVFRAPQHGQLKRRSGHEGRPQVVKEYFKLPAAEIDQQNRPKPLLVSTPPKVDVATLKAARLKLELEDKTASLRQASLD